MQQSLSGRVALVTGASRGIGCGIALELAQQGACVVALARDAAALSALVSESSVENTRFIPHACDLSDARAIAPLAAMVSERFGRLDILISNAAIMGPRTTLGEVSEDDWAAVFATNVTANWRLIRHLNPLLLQSDAPRAVFMTSGSGSKLAPGRGVYAISKSALDAVVRTYAAEAEGTKLRVMLCNPGPTRTGMRPSIKPDEDPLSLPTPADIARAIIPMCQPEWQENGKFFDVPENALLSFRGPA